MPFPALLAALAAAPSIYKGLTGLFQSNKKVEERPYVPPAFSDSLAQTRQAANSTRLPGEGQQLDRIAQGTAAVNAGAVRAGGSSADVLAALGASDARRQQALGELGARGDAYRQQQQGVLRQQENQLGAYQLAGHQAAEREQAALTESGQRNIFGALDGLSQVATYGLNKDSRDPDAGSDDVGLGRPSPLPADLQRNRYDQYPATPGRRYRGAPYSYGLSTPSGF